MLPDSSQQIKIDSQMAWEISLIVFAKDQAMTGKPGSFCSSLALLYHQQEQLNFCSGRGYLMTSISSDLILQI